MRPSCCKQIKSRALHPRGGVRKWPAGVWLSGPKIPAAGQAQAPTVQPQQLKKQADKSALPAFFVHLPQPFTESVLQVRY